MRRHDYPASRAWWRNGAWRGVAGWLAPVLVAVIALGLRLKDLGTPHAVVFDETYYAKEAWSLLQNGVVLDYPESANEQILHGHVDGLTTGDPTWIVHPNGGRWMIAMGEQIFGMTPFGWRFAAAVVGSLTVLILARLVLRLTGSIVIGTFAGMLWALDGVAFTMSRIALLDIFLAFWVVAGVGALVVDRDKLGLAVAEDPLKYRLWRPWLLIAGLCFGMAAGTKWSGFVVLAAFGVTIVIWELALRYRTWWGRGLSRRRWILAPWAVGVPAFFWLVVVACAVYLGTWTDWLGHHQLYEARFGHGYLSNPPWPSVVDPYTGPFANVVNPLHSLWSFHQMTWGFHTGEYLASKTHPYQSHPLGWMVQERPTSAYYVGDLPPAGCGAPADSSCLHHVVILGNPVVWWSGVLAWLFVAVAWVRALAKRHDAWRWSLPLVGLAATWVPWFSSGTRPIFSFYAVAILPFTVVAIGLSLSAIKRVAERHNKVGLLWSGLGVYAVLVIAGFVFFYPIWTAQLMSYPHWHLRMWFDSWI